MPAGWLRFFSTPELQRLIGGDDVALDVSDLKGHSLRRGVPRTLTHCTHTHSHIHTHTHTHPRACTHTHSRTCRQVRDLWAVLTEFSREERALFLKFVTSCSKPPLLGFVHLQPAFTVQVTCSAMCSPLTACNHRAGNHTHSPHPLSTPTLHTYSPLALSTPTLHKHSSHLLSTSTPPPYPLCALGCCAAHSAARNDRK